MLVIPGLYFLFGTMADKGRLIQDEADGPLSGIFEHEPEAAHH